jgi:hypothetical protein
MSKRIIHRNGVECVHGRFLHEDCSSCGETVMSERPIEDYSLPILWKRIDELEADKHSLKEKLKLYIGGWPSLEKRIAELEDELREYGTANISLREQLQICKLIKDSKIQEVAELEAVLSQYRDNANTRMVIGFDFDAGEYPVTSETVSILCAENQRLKAKLRKYVPQKTLVPPKEKSE